MAKVDSAVAPAPKRCWAASAATPRLVRWKKATRYTSAPRHQTLQARRPPRGWESVRGRGGDRTARFTSHLSGGVREGRGSAVAVEGGSGGPQVLMDRGANALPVAGPHGLEDLGVVADRVGGAYGVAGGEPGHAQLPVAQRVVQLGE